MAGSSWYGFCHLLICYDGSFFFWSLIRLAKIEDCWWKKAKTDIVFFFFLYENTVVVEFRHKVKRFHGHSRGYEISRKQNCSHPCGWNVCWCIEGLMSGGLSSIDNTFSLGTHLSILVILRGKWIPRAPPPSKPLQRHHTLTETITFSSISFCSGYLWAQIQSPKSPISNTFFVMFCCSSQEVFL